MNNYSFPGLSRLDQKVYYYNEVRRKDIAYAQRFDRIMTAVEKATGKNLKEIQSRKRKMPLPFLRAIISEELYSPGDVSYNQIGSDLCRDHTTIMYYIKDLIPSVIYNTEFHLLKDNIKRYINDYDENTYRSEIRNRHTLGDKSKGC